MIQEHGKTPAWFAIVILGALPALGLRRPAEGPVKVSGQVTDFKNQPVEGASVELKDARFETVAKAVSGKDGRYSLAAAKGRYMALTAVKDYQVRCLEYWAWNVPAERDLEINPRFDRIEVYAMNAWRPQGAYPSYQVYFRPMSLARTGAAVMKARGMEGLKKVPLIDIAPDLGAGDVEARVDGERVDVIRVNKVREASGPAQDMVAYLIQVSLPKAPPAGDWVVIDLTLSDRATGEKGEGRLYLPRRGN
ncbi:MAG TPA: carboxypeptidase-like regulatory domain-containing protein [Terriglobales bacterium]|nr:carboxypeptidase-like regulatory domain-containing protein [Terriglobales bacterium]